MHGDGPASEVVERPVPAGGEGEQGLPAIQPDDVAGGLDHATAAVGAGDREPVRRVADAHRQPPATVPRDESRAAR